MKISCLRCLFLSLGIFFCVSADAVILCNTDKLNRTVCHDENGKVVSGANQPLRVINSANRDKVRGNQKIITDNKTGPVVTTRERIKVEKGQVSVCKQDSRNIKEESCVIQAQPDNRIGNSNSDQNTKGEESNKE